MIILEFCLILMIILSVKIQPVLVQTNAMHMPYILPKTERIRYFDYWTWSQVSIGKKSEEFNKGNTVCFHEANQIWKFYEDASSIHLFKIPFLRGWWQWDGKIAWVQGYLKETPFSFHEPNPNPAVIILRNGFIAQIS